MATYLSGSSRTLAVVRHRNAMLAVGEDVTRTRELLRPHAVDVRGVGNLDHLVALHNVATDPRNSRVRLVVDEDIAAVVRAVGERHVRMVGVAVEHDAALVLQILGRFRKHPVGHDLDRLVGLAPARCAAPVEDGNAHELAHRRDPEDADLARLAARPEAVVVVELARSDMPLAGISRCSGLRRDQRGAGNRAGSCCCAESGECCRLGAAA